MREHRGTSCGETKLTESKSGGVDRSGDTLVADGVIFTAGVRISGVFIRAYLMFGSLSAAGVPPLLFGELFGEGPDFGVFGFDEGEELF